MRNTGIIAPGGVTVLGWQTLAAPAEAAASDWFDVDRWLGKRGHKYLSEATRYWLAATSALAVPDTVDGDRQGIVVGTNFGAHRTLTELFDVARASGSSALSPLSSPNFSINLIASHAAIKARARRMNLTLTTPQVAGLDALAEASRSLLSARCDAMLAGAAEEGTRSAAPLPPRLQGAMAASLVRAELASPGQGLASLSGFTEAHVPSATGWPVQSDAIGALLRRRMPDPARLAGARVCLVGDAAALRAALQGVAAAAGAAAPADWHALAPSHACLEPLQILQDATRDSAPTLFLYANRRGAFRGVLVDPITLTAN